MSWYILNVVVAKNLVEFAEGIIINRYVGDQTDTTVRRVVSDSKKYIDQRRAAGLPILILVDLTALGQLALSARIEGGRAIRKIPYDKIAIFGAKLYVQRVVTLMARAVHKEAKMKIFPTQQAARAWLTDAQ
jgi:hypothetical protein